MADAPEPSTPAEQLAQRRTNLDAMISKYERELIHQAERALVLEHGPVKVATRSAAAEIASIIRELRVIAELTEQRALGLIE